jgi:hypothetical protein
LRVVAVAVVVVGCRGREEVVGAFYRVEVVGVRCRGIEEGEGLGGGGGSDGGK